MWMRNSGWRLEMLPSLGAPGPPLRMRVRRQPHDVPHSETLEDRGQPVVQLGLQLGGLVVRHLIEVRLSPGGTERQSGSELHPVAVQIRQPTEPPPPPP